MTPDEAGSAVRTTYASGGKLYSLLRIVSAIRLPGDADIPEDAWTGTKTGC